MRRLTSLLGYHVIAIWSGEFMGADAAFQVIFDHLGLRAPPEEQALPLPHLRRQAVTPGGQVSLT